MLCLDLSGMRQIFEKASKNFPEAVDNGKDRA
jgi:hypothetical protein